MQARQAILAALVLTLLAAIMEDSDGWEVATSRKRYTKKPPNPPLLITIGPQACGKTTFLKNLGDVRDIAIDDVPECYEKIPCTIVNNFLDAPSASIPHIHRNVMGIPVSERLLDQKTREQLTVLRLFSQKVSLDQAIAYFGMSIDDEIMRGVLINTVSNMYIDGFQMESKTMDLFILEAVFSVGVRQASQRLEHSAHQCRGIVSWGNTNLNPDHYANALDLAMQTRRPVRFVRWGSELPRISIEELYIRNVQRFLKTGRYIPLETIQMCVSRADELLTRAAAIPNPPTGLPMGTDGTECVEGAMSMSTEPSHPMLAAVAGFDMDAHGFVKRSNGSPRRNSRSSGSPKRSNSRSNSPAGNRATSGYAGTASDTNSENVASGLPVDYPWSPWTNDGGVFPLR